MSYQPLLPMLKEEEYSMVMDSNVEDAASFGLAVVGVLGKCHCFILGHSDTKGHVGFGIFFCSSTDYSTMCIVWGYNDY